ncbi:hypothetical protein D3C78_1106620 [compost metagenome]
MGDGQLLAQLGRQRIVQGEGQHAEQAVERGADFVAHAGEEVRACLDHFQGEALRLLQLAVGVEQFAIGAFQCAGALMHALLQLAQRDGQVLFGGAALGNLVAEQRQLTVAGVDQQADLVVPVAAGAGQGGLVGQPRVASAEVVDQAVQRAGQQQIGQAEQGQAEQQAAEKTANQGDAGAMQEAAAVTEGVDLDALQAGPGSGVLRQGQRILEGTSAAEHQVAEPVLPVVRVGDAAGAGQRHAAVIEQLGVQYRRSLQQSLHQFSGQFLVPVVERSRRRGMADRQQGVAVAVDGRVLAGIVVGHLDQAEQGAEDKGNENGQAGLLEGKSLREGNIHIN